MIALAAGLFALGLVAGFSVGLLAGRYRRADDSDMLIIETERPEARWRCVKSGKETWDFFRLDETLYEEPGI